MLVTTFLSFLWFLDFRHFSNNFAPKKAIPTIKQKQTQRIKPCFFWRGITCLKFNLKFCLLPFLMRLLVALDFLSMIQPRRIATTFREKLMFGFKWPYLTTEFDLIFKNYGGTTHRISLGPLLTLIIFLLIDFKKHFIWDITWPLCHRYF